MKQCNVPDFINDSPALVLKLWSIKDYFYYFHYSLVFIKSNFDL